MKVVDYLPSGQFSVIVVSIALSAGLIIAAQYVTRPPATDAAVISDNQPQPTDNWQASLDAIQAQAPGLPPAPSDATVQALLKDAQSSNVTNSVARSVFVNLGSAGAQGLGTDLPTQEKIIADAATRMGSIPVTLHTQNDLTAAPQTKIALKTWGNAVMKAFVDHPKASNDDALLALGYATDYHDASRLSTLSGIGDAYEALAASLLAVPVPPTLSSLYLQLINDLLKMSAATGEMQTVVSDPLRGLSGLQSFQTAGGEAARLLTTMKQQLNKGGILFTKDEPGSLWSSFPDSP